MLTLYQIQLVAEALTAKLGESALAGAVLRAQEAAARGDVERLMNWRRIAKRVGELLGPNLQTA